MNRFLWTSSLSLVVGVFFGCAPDLKVTETDGSGGSGGRSETSSSSASTGGSSSGGPECNDNIDNDSDSLVDCADTNECGSAITCQTSVPTGWRYVLIRQTSFGDNAALCPNGQEPQHTYMNPANSDCSACNCSTSGSCTNTLLCYAQNGCAGAVTANDYGTVTGCVPFIGGGGAQSCKVSGNGMLPPGVSCNVSGGALKKAIPFDKELHLCEAEVNVGGCDPNTCVMTGSGDYEKKRCVARSGEVDCADGFPERYVVYSQYADSRSCSACVCDGNQITCGGATTITLWTDSLCTANGTAVADSNGCQGIPLATSYVNVVQIPKVTVPAAACQGGVGSGSVNAAEPLTVCCHK